MDIPWLTGAQPPVNHFGLMLRLNHIWGWEASLLYRSPLFLAESPGLLLSHSHYALWIGKKAISPRSPLPEGD
jgi:hypothetical protein